MPRSSSSFVSSKLVQAAPARPESVPDPKRQAAGVMSVREELWWSRRLASGSDWMEEWIVKPGRR